MLTAGLTSSLTDEWATPQALFDALDREFRFTVDVCATHSNAKCRRYYTKAEDGLKQDWAGETVFMNPPYGRAIGQWVRKAAESRGTAVTVGILPARTDTQWWHDYVNLASEIRFIRGRLKFGGAESSAPFPSAVAVWGLPMRPVYTVMDAPKLPAAPRYGGAPE